MALTEDQAGIDQDTHKLPLLPLYLSLPSATRDRL